MPEIAIVGEGRRMELYKDVGRPEVVTARIGLRAMAGTHGIGHTRMATELAVTIDGAHPFSTGPDQCLVHNGSLSNHNIVRRSLQHEGFSFRTENDTEVAAGYLTWRMRQGMSLGEALDASLDDLDGFYTFVVGTESGFGVLARSLCLQARGHGRNRELRRLRLANTARSPAFPASRRRGSGSRSRASSISGSAA